MPSLSPSIDISFAFCPLIIFTCNLCITKAENVNVNTPSTGYEGTDLHRRYITEQAPVLGYCGHDGDPALYGDPAIVNCVQAGDEPGEHLPCLSRLLWIMHYDNILAKVVV